MKEILGQELFLIIFLDRNILWQVPNTPTTQGRFRITDAGNGNIVDISDANFTIEAASPFIIVDMTVVKSIILINMLKLKEALFSQVMLK